MSTTTKLELKLRTLRQWLKPYAMVRDALHGNRWLVISYPWTEDGRILVKVRDCPESPLPDSFQAHICTVDALALEPAPKEKP